MNETVASDSHATVLFFDANIRSQMQQTNNGILYLQLFLSAEALTLSSLYAL
jgi:hypothetical protein